MIHYTSLYDDTPLPLENVFSPPSYQDDADFFDLLYLSSDSTPFHLSLDIKILYELLKINGPLMHPIGILSEDHPYQDSTLPDVFSHRIFQSNEDIMEVMSSLDYPWDDLHHRSYYLPQATNTSLASNQYTIETKDFIPSIHIDWFRNPIPSLDAFEEDNMANISSTI